MIIKILQAIATMIGVAVMSFTAAFIIGYLVLDWIIMPIHFWIKNKKKSKNL